MLFLSEIDLCYYLNGNDVAIQAFLNFTVITLYFKQNKFMQRKGLIPLCLSPFVNSQQCISYYKIILLRNIIELQA